MTYASAERAALCDLFERLGPEAPTLCAGWTTADLAAHLVLRERRPDALVGIAVPPLARYTASVQQRIKSRPWPELIELVRRGPARWTRLIPGMDGAINTLEFFVHHEDVRRAQPGWEPRELPAGLVDLLWKRLRGAMTKMMLRRAPVGVILRRADGEAAGGKKAEPHVVVTGDPGELLMVVFGRQEHARVSWEGDQASVERLHAANLGP